MSDATEPSGAKVRLRDRLWAQIAGAILLVLAVFAVAFYGFAMIDTHPARLWPWSAKTHPGLYELSRTAVPVAALVGGAAAIVVGIRRQRSTEKTVELTARTAQITADAYALDQKRAGREEIDRLRDRYTTIAAQLGDDAAPVRLAGVYAMAALADDWITMGNHREAQVCIDVLCAYIRTPRHTTTSEDAVADTRVRETITRVITQHLQVGAATSWSDKVFDFTEAHFTGSHSFDSAEFNGGCQVLFSGAEFNEGCQVRFLAVKFNEGCQVDFFGAKFNEGCQVRFPAVKFNEGCQVDFFGAKFNEGCQVDFFGAEFNEGCQVEFFGAEFNEGCQVEFPRVKFNEGCQVNFPAKFNKGCQVEFVGAKFNEGCQVNFSDAEFNEGWPIGPWGDGSPPLSGWPPSSD